MKPTNFSAAAAGLLLPLASAAPNLPPASEMPSHVTGRSATGSGPRGLVTENDIDGYFSVKAMKLSSTFPTPESTASKFVSKCLTPTTAKYEDCIAAISDLHGYPGNFTVQNGLCFNWWEGSCLVKVCSVQGPYSGNGAQIADTMTSTLLNPCIKQGNSGVDSDCDDINGQCGTYRYWLMEYAGEYDWAL